MLIFGILLIGYGLIAVIAAVLNKKLAWWTQTRPEFVVRALTALGLGMALLILSWIAL